MPHNNQLNKQTKKTGRYMLICLFLGFLTLGLYLITDAISAIASFSLEEIDQQIKQEKENISALNNQIDTKEDKIADYSEQVQEYESKIAQKRDELSDLQNQLELLDIRINKTKVLIEKSEEELLKLSLQQEMLELQIQENKAHLAQIKDQLRAIIREMNYYDNKSYLEILILNDNFNEFFNQIKHLENIQHNVYDLVQQVESIKLDLEEKHALVINNQAEQQKVRNDLEAQEAQLEEEKNNQEILIESTKLSQEKFEVLQVNLKAEVNKINAELAETERIAREKLARLEALNSEKEQLLYADDTVMMWPVSPSRGITALFHDKDYPFRYIFEHPAIDIRAYQGTQIKAPLSGYVARAKDNGYGYSYIMLVHGNGISTVFGHVSKIYVKEDEYVKKGDIIGLSGGAPGTLGAGNLSTGPHLHFEVRKNGKPVDPLGGYLSL